MATSKQIPINGTVATPDLVWRDNGEMVSVTGDGYVVRCFRLHKNNGDPNLLKKIRSQIGQTVDLGSRFGKEREVQMLIIDDNQYLPYQLENRLLYVIVKLVPNNSPQNWGTKIGQLKNRWINPVRHAMLRAMRSSNPIHHIAEESLTGTLMTNSYSWETNRIGVALSAIGGFQPGKEELRILRLWWSRLSDTDIEMLVHPDHLHIVYEPSLLPRLVTESNRNRADIYSCRENPLSPNFVQDLGIATITDFRADPSPPETMKDIATDDVWNPPTNQWLTKVWDYGAVAVSLRFVLTPPGLTTREAREIRTAVKDELMLETGDLDLSGNKIEAELDRILRSERHISATKNPRITNISGLIAFGYGATPDAISKGLMWRGISDQIGVDISSMDFRQLAAFQEMMPGSPVRVAPTRHEVSSTRFGEIYV